MSVSSFRNCDTAVIRSERSMENFVIGWNDGSCPTMVMSVPCSVVTIAELGGGIINLTFKGDAAQTESQRHRAATVLEGSPYVGTVSDSGTSLVVTATEGGRSLPRIVRALDEAGVYVDEMTLTSPTLDDVFLKYTGERIREDAPVQNWRNQRFMRPGMGSRGGAGRRP